jgi:hypothetical protein
MGAARAAAVVASDSTKKRTKADRRPRRGTDIAMGFLAERRGDPGLGAGGRGPRTPLIILADRGTVKNGLPGESRQEGRSRRGVIGFRHEQEFQ